MSPTFGDVEELRAALMDFRRRNDFGRAAPDVRLQLVEPLIETLRRSVTVNEKARALMAGLMICVKKSPIYARGSDDWKFGAEPIYERWIVADYKRFNEWIDRARAFAEEME
ncbi:MAG TPA: hypothetical protein VFH85_07825 [Gammaproteobacteria bacterium]|nr:hypothetical protein [Gammaproteobacteria bacterium]